MSDQNALIAQQNDQFRTSLGINCPIPGTVVLTSGVASLADALRTEVLRAVVQFNTFTEDNDPYGEHDFGSIELPDMGRFLWKIDYYAPDLMHGSEDPTDLTQTHRVLTIMFASEY
ncbi:MAG: DUF3768 domain-containing protein [Caldilineaceae bacterium]